MNSGGFPVFFQIVDLAGNQVKKGKGQMDHSSNLREKNKVKQEAHTLVLLKRDSSWKVDFARITKVSTLKFLGPCSDLIFQEPVPSSSVFPSLFQCSL